MYISFKQLSGHLTKTKNYGNTMQLWYEPLILKLINNSDVIKFIGTRITQQCQLRNDAFPNSGIL